MFLTRALAVFFLFLSLQALNAQGREVVAILPVEVRYPSRGHEWFGGFLQDELIRQFRFQKQKAAVSPELLSRWIPEGPVSPARLASFRETVKPHWLLRLEVQQVLKQVSLSGLLLDTTGESPKQEISVILPLETPDRLIREILKVLSGGLPGQKLIHYPKGYAWEGIELFYKWKRRKLTPVNAGAWREQLENLEALKSAWPALSEQIHYERARMFVLQASVKLPAYVPVLNRAENELKQALALNPASDAHHTLLSLVHYLRREKMQTKSEAVVANAANPRNGRALILYGLTIGMQSHEGVNFIRQGLEWYPLDEGASTTEPDPFEALVSDLEPWLSGNSTATAPDYPNLIEQGEDHYGRREWKRARSYFQEAFALEPKRPEAPLFLARIRIAEKDFKGALEKLKKLSGRFPEHAGIVLYLGFAHEKLKNLTKAELLYRRALEMEPENHRAMLRLSTLLIKTGKHEEALSFLESLTRKYPDYTVGWWNLGLLYQRIGELEMAERALEEAVRLEPSKSQVRTQLERVREELSQGEGG